MLPQNYRPICIIPILYKLFSKLLYNRLYLILDKAQCADQAGFRHRFSTVDHMFVCTMVFEKSEEFQLNSWIAALDFKRLSTPLIKILVASLKRAGGTQRIHRCLT